MAREIQLAILPHEVPRISGLEIAARYIPMSQVAGDFYDFLVVDEKRIRISLPMFPDTACLRLLSLPC